MLPVGNSELEVPQSEGSPNLQSGISLSLQHLPVVPVCARFPPVWSRGVAARHRPLLPAF